MIKGMLTNVLLAGWRTNTGIVAFLVGCVLGMFNIADPKVVQAITDAAMALVAYGIAKKMDTANSK